MLAPEKLRLLTFPQRIAGDQLDVRVLVLPTQNLLNDLADFPSQASPGTLVKLPKFIGGTLGLALDAIQGAATYPFSDPVLLAADGASLQTLPTGAAFPGDLPALYEGLSKQVTIVPGTGAAPPAADADGIRKYLPVSYRTSFNFTTPRTPFARTDDSYHCAIRRSSAPDKNFAQSGNDVTWGRVIAFCLRQPLLAERIGLMHRLQITLPTADYFRDGGWIACRLTSSPGDFSIATPATELRSYAARIPPITTPRPLFAAVLFPYVENAGQVAGNFDTLKIEASDYDDGFAKVVHAVQPVSSNLLSEEFDGQHPQKDIGIRLGWDDEQVLIWLNRQMLADPSTPGKRIEAPLGVFSYRADVRRPGAPNWRSLVRTRSKAALTLAGVTVAPEGTEIETGVQVYPSTVNADAGAPYWLPSYFTQWYGPSLVLPDARAAELDASGALADPGKYSDARIPPTSGQVGNLYDAVLSPDAELKYGDEYEFRVRLTDLAGGGPDETDTAINDAPAASATRRFLRYVAPKALTVTPDAPQPAPGTGSRQFYSGDSFTILRPRLGYPALLFTELDTTFAFEKLKEDRDFLHPGGLPNDQTIKEYRAVGHPDPDVDRVLVVVEVKTLALDTQASISGREPFLPLYSTIRAFDPDLETPYSLQLDYRDANVVDFADPGSFGDLGISQAEIDAGGAIVLPRSRDVRLTVYPVCADKPGKTYYGFGTTHVNESLLRLGERTQFFVRDDAADELAFFRPGLESHQLQAIYLQPDPPQVSNPATLLAALVEAVAKPQSPVIERLAAQLGLRSKGQSLLGLDGERIQFGCSHRLRHTLAPDHASITFATADELIHQWICVLSFEIQRDWTWDGLADEGIEVRRTQQFTGDAATTREDVVGYIALKKTASRTATTGPDRTRTRVVFIDAVEPKKPVGTPETLAHPFPNTIDVAYTLTPSFIPPVAPDAPAREAQSRNVQLPVTTIPAQVPRIVAAGYALSPYQRTHDYSETAVRQRFLWFEFAEPIQDPHDTYFARVLAYAPDPLLSFPNPDQLLVRQDDPPLAIAPELIRVITHGLGNDDAGLDAMQPMEAETPDPSVPLVPISPVHYLLPLPPGLHAESPELFGFFTYELRVGHTHTIWCTAQGRFGHPTRLGGVQHPAPPLRLLTQRTPAGMSVTAPYAQAVFNGRNVTSRPPKTELWCLLYAQVTQADGRERRNVLLAEGRLQLPQQKAVDVGKFLASREALPPIAFNSLTINLETPQAGTFEWTASQIAALLRAFHLAADTPLSVLAVEMMPRYDRYVLFSDAQPDFVRPLSTELGQYRILRTSRLTAAPEVCCVDC